MYRKRLDNFTRVLRAMINKFWKQHPIKQQRYGHLCLKTHPKPIQIRQTIHAGHCSRSKDELTRNVFSWTPSHKSVGRPAWTYLQQPCMNTGCSLNDLSGAMNYRDERRERVREIYINGTRWWRWWWYIHIWIFVYVIHLCNVSLNILMLILCDVILNNKNI